MSARDGLGMIKRTWIDYQLHGFVTSVSFRPHLGFRAMIAEVIPGEPDLPLVAFSKVSEDDARDKVLVLANAEWPPNA